MFPAPTMIQILELRVNQLTLDLFQEQQVSAALGELVEDQCDLIAELRNKITALEAIIAEDAKITNDAADWLDNYILNDA